ncbi:MAG TPA: Grx4 family monothiol glutaredoxin, partial [Rudaea sp.]
MSLSDTTRSRIQTLLQRNPVVLFMKGNPQAPRCGFSAAASGVLNELIGDYATVDVLEDPEIREGIKAYGNWPTIPQLYVKGELIGGADIVQSMYNSGELHQLFGVAPPDR